MKGKQKNKNFAVTLPHSKHVVIPVPAANMPGAQLRQAVAPVDWNGF